MVREKVVKFKLEDAIGKSVPQKLFYRFRSESLDSKYEAGPFDQSSIKLIKLVGVLRKTYNTTADININ